MGTVATAIANAFRKYATDGVPSSGRHNPSKDEIISLGPTIEAADAAVVALVEAVDERVDDIQEQIAAGVRWATQAIRVRSTGNVNIASALENGDTLNGVTLATGDHVFLGLQSTASQNGIYTVVASGAASRATFADSAAELANLGFVIREGTTGNGERYVLSMAADDITVGSTDLNFSLIGIEPSYAAEITEARGGFTDLDDRLDDMTADIAATAGITDAVTETDAFVDAMAPNIGPRQVIGNDRTMVVGTAMVGNRTIAFVDPVDRSGFLKEVTFWAHSTNSFTIKRFNSSGVQVGSDYPVTATITSGAENTLTRANFGYVPVVAGERLGFYFASSSPTLGTSTGTIQHTPFIDGGSGNGNLSDISASSLVSDRRVQAKFVVTGLDDAGQKATDNARRLNLTASALARANLAYGVFDVGLLFSAYDGAWWDINDLTSLRQNTDGTGAVTAFGDPVGYIIDKSGNGYDLYSSGTSRPTLDFDPDTGRFRLWFDGTDDFFHCVRTDMVRNLDKLNVFAVAKFDNWVTTTKTVVYHSLDGTGSSARFWLRQNANSPRPFTYARRIDADSLVNTNAYYDPGGKTQLLESDVDYENGVLTVFQNGVMTPESVVSLTSSGKSADSPARYSTIGSAGPAANFMHGYIYEIVQVRDMKSEELRIAVSDELTRKHKIQSTKALKYDAKGPLFGTWTWFNDPRVIALSSTRAIVGAVNTAGMIYAADYDFAKGIFSHAEVGDLGSVDDHNNPCFVLLPDGRVRLFWSGHGTYDSYWTAITTGPVDDGEAIEWEAAVDIGADIYPVDAYTHAFSYANAFYMPAEDAIYLFFRGGEPGTATEEPWYLSIWPLEDAAPGTGIPISPAVRPYGKFCLNGTDRIDWLLNDGHPGAYSENRTWHVYIKNGNYYKSDGTLIKALSAGPLDTATEATLVYTPNLSVPGMGKSWVYEIKPAPTAGHLMGTISIYPIPGGPDTDFRMRRVYWNGTAWSTAEIAKLGSNLGEGSGSSGGYPGGAAMDPLDENVAYICREVDEHGYLDVTTGMHQLFKAWTEDDWATVQLRQLTFDRETKGRPFIPDGMRRVFYHQGYYRNFVSFGNRIESFPMVD